MLKIYGVKSCDTCRKARKWLKENNIEHVWVDLRESPVERSRVEEWLEVMGVDQLINRRSTTWRELAEDRRTGLAEQEAIDLVLEKPTVLKRPLFEGDSELRVGFTDEIREWILSER